MLVSSHLLSEMQLLADDVVIIAAGKLIRQGPVDEVLGSMAQRRPGPGAHAAGRGADRGAARAVGATVDDRRHGVLLVSGVDAPAIGAPPSPPGSSCTS